MIFNLKVMAIAAIIPMVVGFIYYHPRTFGSIWMRVNDLTDEKLRSGNMLLIMILSLVLSFMMSMAINSLVIHQNHVYSTLANEPGINEPGSASYIYLQNFLNTYGENFRTFKHGALHGFLFSIFFVLPLMATAAMFERRGTKYIFINWGYWAITITLMGGVICEFS